MAHRNQLLKLTVTDSDGKQTAVMYTGLQASHPATIILYLHQLAKEYDEEMERRQWDTTTPVNKKA